MAPLFRLQTRSRTIASTLLAAGIAVAGVFAATLAPSQAEAADKVTLRLDWLPSGYHAPLFLALKKGYYTDAGIDLVIEDGKGTNPALQAVAAGNDMIVLANYASVIQSVAKGMPLMAIGGLVERAPDSIVSLKDTPITDPKQLEGKTMVLTPDSSSAKLFLAMVAATKLDLSKIKVLNVNSNAVQTTLLNGQADAMMGWTFTDALKVATQKPIATPLPIADYGVNVLGTGFVVTKDTAATKGDILKRFMAATAKGYAEGVKDPESAVAAMVEARPMVDHDLQLKQLQIFPPFLHTPNTVGKPFGWTAQADWDQTYALQHKYFDMKDTVDVSKIYTNEFLAP